MINEKSKAIIEKLYKINAIKFGDFTLSSGKHSVYYLDLRIIPSYPELFSQICKMIVDYLESSNILSNIQVIAGVPVAGLSYSTLVAYLTKKPLIFVRSEPKKHGTQKQIEGVFEKDSEALVIDDVLTTGGSLKKSILAMRKYDLKVSHAIILINREEGGVENLKEIGVTVHSLFTITEVADILRESNIITDEEVRKIQKQIKGEI